MTRAVVTMEMLAVFSKETMIGISQVMGGGARVGNISENQLSPRQTTTAAM